MAEYFPVIVEREKNGTFSAYIAGLPGVYAAAGTATVAKRRIRIALADHLRALHELRQVSHANAEMPRDTNPTSRSSGDLARRYRRRDNRPGTSNLKGEVASHGFPDSDWRTFRELQQIALERFCKRTLEEVQAILADRSRTHHERYVRVFRLLRKRDDELAHAFNDPRRSRMIGQLVAIYTHGLLQPDEMERFTERTRATIESIAKEFGR